MNKLKKLEDFLESLDLTGNEAKIYLTILKHNGLLIRDIARHASIHRVTTYQVISSLERKGILITEGKQNKTKVFAIPPYQLQKILDVQKNKIVEQEKQLEKLLPEFESLFGQSNVKPRVRLFEGWHSLDGINQDIINHLNVGDTMYSFTNVDRLISQFEGYLKSPDGFLQKRIKKKINNKALVVDTEFARQIQKKDKESFRETKLISQKKFPFTHDITLYGNRVGILSLDNDLAGVIIESKDIVHNFRVIHKLIWDLLDSQK